MTTDFQCGIIIVMNYREKSDQIKDVRERAHLQIVECIDNYRDASFNIEDHPIVESLKVISDVDSQKYRKKN